ncbi:MAG: DUF481 domain-containing protein [Deltaproteobacteria bacterium]|nr:DUF481 domain-containing protein [Deltaproteobacteria bacterium]
MRIAPALTASCLLLALAAPASAQIVNVQPLVTRADTEGFQGELTGSLTLQTGNTELFLVNGGLLALYGHGIHRLISSSAASVGYRGGINGESRFMQRLFTHLRWQVRMPRLVTWETYAQVAQDRFRRLSLRVLGGTGPRFDLIEGPAVSLALGISYMLEHERLSQTELSGGGVEPAREETNHRASLYLSARFIIDPIFSLIHTSYFQPLLTDPFGDFRFSSETGLAIGITKTVSLAVTFSVAYDSDPPVEVRKTDTTTDVKLAVAF